VSRHLNVFLPYERHAPTHEDQLTRALIIVCRLVPVAREALLRRLNAPSLAQLPAAEFDIQVGSGDLGADRENVISVFLTPDLARIPSSFRPTTPPAQRLDGLIRFGLDELVVVIESKLFVDADDRQWIGVSNRTAHIAWHDLLGDWLDLDGRGLLAPAEREVIRDFFEFGEQHFSWLLPFSTLARCGSDDTRQWRRLVGILGAATSLPVQEREHVYVSVDRELGTRSLQRIALEIHGDQLELRAWPGVLTGQAQYLYAHGRAQRGVDQLTRRGWAVSPNMYLTFWNDPGSGTEWLNVTLPVAEYVARLANQDSDLPYQHDRSEYKGDLWPRLVADGYATGHTNEDRDRFMERLKNRQTFYLRAALATYYAWPYQEAVEMDNRDDELVREVRERINELLAALDEPLLETPTR
jgi:hypothetical protein